MSVTVDASVLVCASNASDPAHARARALVERCQHGVGTIYTGDRSFRRYDGIRVEDPFA